MKTVSSLSKNPHLENLTWLRAIAAFFVVVSHSIRTAEVQYAPNDEKSYFLPLNLLDLGSFGVCLFFALSGCALYLSNKYSVRSFSDFLMFYLKRFMRIWPAFAFSMVLYLLFIEMFRMGYTGNNKFWVAQFLKEYTPATVVRYLSLTFNITGPSVIFVGPYWSLPVEFQYYLLLPFAIFYMSNRVKAFLIPVIFSVILYAFYKYQLVSIDRYEIFRLGYTFFGGVVLAYMYQGVKFRISASIGLIAFAVLVCLAGLIVTGRLIIPDNVRFFSDSWNCYGILAILCVALALFSKTPVIPNTIRSLLNEYGEVSYSIYLFHMLFIGISAIAITRLEIYGNLKKLSFILAFSSIFSFLFSKLTYKYIELPSINCGKFLTEYLKVNKGHLTAHFSKSP
jgi:peptidoglycan/LPS O-acetylase OafA/YrhL